MKAAGRGEEPVMRSLGRAAMAALRWTVVLCIAAMVVLVFSNVVLRYAFNSGISISEELSRYFFVWLIFAGAVVAMHERAHLGVDTLVARLPRRGRLIFGVAADLIMLGCCLLLLTGGARQTVVNMVNKSPVSGLPVGWMHAAAVLASLGLIVVIGLHLWRLLSGRASDADLLPSAAGPAEAHAEPATRGDGKGQP